MKSSFLVKLQAYSLQATTLPEMNFSTGIIQRFCQLFTKNYFKEDPRMAASVHFSRNFVATSEHVLTGSVVSFHWLRFYLTKET